MLQKALQFLYDHNEVAFATCEGNLRPIPPILKHFDLMTGDVHDGFVGERFTKNT